MKRSRSKEVLGRLCGIPLVLSGVVLALLAATGTAQSSFQGELLNLARQAERYGKVQEAERLYHQTLSDNPNNQFAHHRLAVLTASRGELQKSVEHFASAVEAGPPSAQLLSDYGGALFLKDDLEQAEQKLKAALTLDPQNRGARNNLDLVVEKLNIRREAEAQAREKARKAANAQAMAKLKVDETARAAAQAIADVRTAEKARAVAEARAAAELRAAAEAVAKARAAEQARKLAEARAADEARKLAQSRAAEQARKQAELRAAAKSMAEAKTAERARKLAVSRAAEEARKLDKVQADAKSTKLAKVPTTARAIAAAKQTTAPAKKAEPKKIATVKRSRSPENGSKSGKTPTRVERQSTENQARVANLEWLRSDGRYPTTSAKILAPGVKGAIVRYIEPPKPNGLVYRIHDLQTNDDSQKSQAANEDQAENEDGKQKGQEDESASTVGDQAEGIEETQAEEEDALMEPPVPNLHSLFLPHTGPFPFSSSGIQQATFTLPLKVQQRGYNTAQGVPGVFPLRGTFTRLRPIKPADGNSR